MKRHSVEENLVPLQPQMKTHQRYQERLVKWNSYSMKNLALCYEFRTGSEAETLELVPDACLDFMFHISDHAVGAVASGMQSAPQTLLLEPNAVYFGFKPYSAKGMRNLAVRWSELQNDTIDLKEQISCESLLEQMLRAGSFDERVDVICAFAAERLADDTYTPDFVEFSELRLCNTKGNIKVEDIADFTGYSGRYCREKFKETNGISIKRYSNIIRFQNVMRMLADSKIEDLSDIVFENGYFDQPHLSREFKLYTGESPLRYRQRVLRMA